MLRTIIAIVIAALPAMASAAQEIPYRYPVQEGFILAIDDASRRAVPQDDPIARAVLDRLAEVLESDIYRVPVEYGRTLAWNNGELLVGGMGRADHLALYNRSRDRDVSRIEPASVLFLRLNRQGDGLNARMDWVDVVRGETLARYASDPVQATDAEAAAELLTPFFRDTAEDIIDRLGPAPPRGYGAVPPPWLIAPIYYQIDLRDLPEEIRAEAVDFLTVELPYYLGSSIVSVQADRMVLSYETKAPSWWIAGHLDTLFSELDFAARIEPREAGLRISPAE